VSWAATVASCVLIVAWGLGYHVPDGLLFAVAVVAAAAQRRTRRAMPRRVVRIETSEGIIYEEFRRDRDPE
jgi:hypothetical protein